MLYLIGAVVILLVFFVLRANTPKAHALRKSRREKEAEAARQREEAYERRVAAFCKTRWVVVIRQKDGRKTEVEALVINDMTKTGATVLFVNDDQSRKIASGDLSDLPPGALALIGTGWSTEEGAGGIRYHCDFRVVERSGEDSVLRCAAYTSSYGSEPPVVGRLLNLMAG